ncbi:MAG TPA: YcxB family protein [Ruminococcus sp.]|nr:YcxB family protein [Ruminococcus sp.]
MIKADIHYGEGHYKTAVKNKGNPFLKAMGYSLIVAVGLAFLIKLSFDLLKYHAWILWLYGAVFIAVNGFTLVRLEALLLGVKKHVIKTMSSVSCSVEFDEEELILRYDTKAEFGESKVNFAFHADKFTAEHSGKDFSDKIELNYDKLDKVYETKEYFLLYLRSNTAFIIGKNEICEGSPQALRELLRTKFGKRYKTK